MTKRRAIPYSRQWVGPDDVREVVRVLTADYITQGPKVREFEDALARYCRARYAVAVSSGTAALHIACLAGGLGRGDEAITSPISFVASANCAVYCGGRPVFADIQEDTFNVDPDDVKRKITKRTKAIIPVDFAGHPCDMAEIVALARRHGAIVIEDASHALGAEYKGKKVGGLADMTVFSFHPVKSITTGEGGAVMTNDKRLYQRLMRLRTHGITRDPRTFLHKGGPWYYEMQALGFNYRITDIQCALGISQMKKLGAFIERRREIASRYNSAFSTIEGIRAPYERAYVRSAYHLYVVRLESKKLKGRKAETFAFLNARGIRANVHYIPIYMQPYYRYALGYRKGLCPRAERYYQEAISLPLYPKMTEKEVGHIISAASEAFAKGGRPPA